MAQNKPSTTAIRKHFTEIAEFMSNPGLRTALESIARDKQLFRKAKANPKAFLAGEGVTLPRGTDVKIMQFKVSGEATAKVHVEFTILGMKFEGDVKVTVKF